MIWEFKRELYCSENGTSKDLFRDLNADSTRNILQDFFDAQGGHPTLWAPDEYAHYFELCHPTAIARERYIQSKVNNIAPSIGHLCLGELFIKKRVVNIWTTNFDELVEVGIKTLSPHRSFNVYSSANKSVSPSNTIPSVIKLHGDYLYDHIKNTPEELQNLEDSMQKSFSESLVNSELVVIGYSGSDESIMNVLEIGITNPDFLKYGLIWKEDIDSLVELVVKKPSDIFLEKIEELERRRDEIRRKITAHELQKCSASIEIYEVSQAMEFGKQLLLTRKLPNMQQLVSLFVDRVTIYPDKIHIRFNFAPQKCGMLKCRHGKKRGQKTKHRKRIHPLPAYIEK